MVFCVLLPLSLLGRFTFPTTKRRFNKMNSVLVFGLVLTLTDIIPRVSSQTYAKAKAVSDDILSSSRYRTDVRPLEYQDSPIEVAVNFQLVSIVGVNDVTQSFVCNGFLVLTWDDEILPWNATQYDDVSEIHPHPKDIWRPRLVLLNTLGARDLFEDDASPVTVSDDGSVLYVPGGLFQASCDLNLKKYPFDDQECSIQMLPMGYKEHELIFEAGTTGLDFFNPNGEWELKGTGINASVMSVGDLILPSFEITFKLSRRPTFFVLNILLPVVLLSLLNMLVFTIPAESGEKVGYGITVVLALSVFLSIVSGMLPKASDIVPSVTIYLFMLLVVSVLTVLDAIVIVFFYNQEEREVKTMKITQQYSTAAAKIGLMHRVIGAFLPNKKVSHGPPTPDIVDSQNESMDSNGVQKFFHKPSARETPRENYVEKIFNVPSEKEAIRENSVEEYRERNDCDKESSKKVNKYKVIGKYIDGISLVVFLLIWLIVTGWYFISVLT